MQQKRVLQLSSNVGFFGAESVILELSKALTATEYQPVIGVFKNSQSPHIELTEAAQKYHIETKVFDCNGRFDRTTIASIKDFVKQTDIRIMQSHGYKTNMYAFFAARDYRVPLVATCHPWIKTCRILKFYAWLDQKFLNRFNKIVAISDEVRNEILNKSIDEKKITIIDNGIDIERFKEPFDINRIREELDISSTAKVIGTIGRLSEEKGHTFFIEAASKLVKDFSNLVFLIVGDGPLRGRLEEQAKESGLQNQLIFTGVRNDIPRILAVMDIFVLPSLTEGLPMVLLEAMAAKKAVVATRVGQVPNIIRHDESGLLVPPKDADSLKNAIAELLVAENKAISFAQKAFTKVVEKYSSRRMAKQYIEIYEELLSK